MPTPPTWREVPALADAAHTLSLLLHDGAVCAAADPARRFTLHTVAVGTLALPSGELVVGDPFNVRTARSFPVRLPRGTHPLWLCRAVSMHPGTGAVLQDRVAGAVLRVAPGEPVQWCAVKVPARGGVVTFSVDSGLACFTDRQTADGLRDRFPPPSAGLEVPDPFTGVVRAALPAGPAGAGAGPWGALDSTGGVCAGAGALWLFESGLGSGRYVIHVGFTDSHAVACVAVDLGVLVETPADGARVGRPLRLKTD